MDHGHCSLLDPGEVQNVEPEVVLVILDSDSHSEWKPADSNNESIPSCSAVRNGEFSVQDTPLIIPDSPSAHSSAETKKRKRNTEFWKRNVRKRKWRNGEEHLNSSGKLCPARCVRIEDTCSIMCPYQCVHIFSKEEREDIHKNFWSLNEDEKLSYYNMYTERITKKRCRTDKQTESRRKFTLKYYLPISDGMSQVCKKFFLSTLDISDRRISYYYSHLHNADTGVHRRKQSGLSKNRKTPTNKEQEVHDHHPDSSGQTEGMSDKSLNKKQEVHDHHPDSSEQTEDMSLKKEQEVHDHHPDSSGQTEDMSDKSLKKEQEVHSHHPDSSGQTEDVSDISLKKEQEVHDHHPDSSGQTENMSSSARFIHFKGTCPTTCPYRCVYKFSVEERENIRKNFWSLNEGEKIFYYGMYTECLTKQRCRTDKQTESRRKFTFKYYLPVLNEKSQVCKKFFLSTLDISERRISYYYSHLHNADTRVNKQKQSFISNNKVTLESKKQEVNDHINLLFPHVGYHYSLSDTSREHLEQSLPKMYTMYRKPQPSENKCI